MKFHRLRTLIPILGIIIFLVSKTSNLSVIAKPYETNVFDFFQTVDKESNVTANTRKLTFKLLLNPVDNQKHNLPFHLKLKTSLWLTNDEFLNLKNYLGDQDFANALSIVRRKFFRRFHAKNLPSDALKYRLLSALVFSSLQGQINVLRNRLNNDEPELLLSVTDYHPNHKDPTQWKPLESNTKDFEFHVENGNMAPPTTPGVTVGSVYDKNFYEKVIFNSIKPLTEFSEAVNKSQESKPTNELNTTEVNEKKDQTVSNTPVQEQEKPKENKTEENVQEKPAQTNENKKEQEKKPVLKHTEETIGGRRRVFDYDEVPSSDNENKNKENVEKNKVKEENKEETSSVRRGPTRRRRREDLRQVDFYRDKDREQEPPKNTNPSKPLRPTLPSQDTLKKVTEALKPSVPQLPKPPHYKNTENKDNNVVDKENPIPTEEVKSNEEEQEKPAQRQQNQNKKEQEQKADQSLPEEAPQENLNKPTEQQPVQNTENKLPEQEPQQTPEQQVPEQPQEVQQQQRQPVQNVEPVQQSEEPQETQQEQEPQEQKQEEPEQVQNVEPVQNVQNVQNVPPKQQQVPEQFEQAQQEAQQEVPEQVQNVKPTPQELLEQRSQQRTHPQQTNENKDNNVVDNENPVPTEEVKSNEEEQTNVNQVPEKPDQSETELESAGNTISNVRKGTDSKMKTTFSLASKSDDSESEPTFFKKKQTSETEQTPSSDEQTESGSGSESESESEDENKGEPAKTEEQMLKELSKKFPPYNETHLMNLYEKVDSEDIEKGFNSPVTITLKVNFMSSDKRTTVPAVTTARLLLPQTIFTMCIREELTQQCAFELKDRLMARFEENKAEAFKWGRLVSLLQTLAFQNDVFVEKYIMNKGEESVIELSRPTFVLPMKTLNFLKQLVGKATSSDGNAQITFDLLPGILNIPVGSMATDLGQNYGTHAQLSRFIELYGDFEVTHSLFDLPTQQRATKKPGEAKSKKSRSRDNRVYSMDELLAMNVDTKDLNNEIHYILSSYEKALFSVPKRLSGYKLMWETVDKYPQLQRLWIEALTLMKLMDKKDNLKNFLANHTFKYQELKDLFEITYGIIAADNFNAVREFYETVGITQKDVDTNLARVKSLFFAKTGSNVTRLPPILKQMHPKCLVKNMITSLSSNDLIERMQVMFVQWINDHKESPDGKNYDLAFLCAGSAILLQHWHYFQLDQNYYDHPVPFITLITSFSRLAQGKYKNPERKKEIKQLINSKAAKQCRKYINSAGILATSPYKTATINMTPKSLLGAIGNALDISMDSPPEEVAYAMKDYFKAELSKGKYGNSLGICLGLQLLYRLNKCFSVERSNDFSLYMHGLLTMNTRVILEKFTEIEANKKNSKNDYNYIKFACNPDNPTVHEAMAKLMPLVSTQSHIDLIEELVRRDMVSPDLTPEGYLAENDNTLNKDVVDLEDDTTTLLETFEDTNPRSLLEIADEVSYDNDDEEESQDSTGESFIQQNYTPGGYGFDVDVVGMPNLDEMDKLYKTLFRGSLINPFFSNSLNNKIVNQLFNKNYSLNQPDNSKQTFNNLLDDDLTMITFDIRMEPLDSKDDLIALDVPFSFHEKELNLIESLESKALLRLLLYRIKKRIDSLEFDLKHEQLKKQALDLAKSKNLEHVSIPVHENVAKGNVDLNTYNGLLRVLESMPEDGYYFEHEGLVIPESNVGKIAAKRIYKTMYRNKTNKSNKKSKNKKFTEFNEPVLILQVIDPVDDTDITDLTMPHDHVKKHDKLFYQKMTEL